MCYARLQSIFVRDARRALLGRLLQVLKTSKGANKKGLVSYAFQPFRVETLGPWGPIADLSRSGLSMLHVTREMTYFLTKESAFNSWRD